MMDALSAVDRLFETQLECIGLTESQIEQQSLAELEESLVLIQLLKREKLIIDRIRLLRGQRTHINTATDQRLQEQRRTGLEAASRSDVMETVEIRRDYAFMVMPLDPQNPHLDDIHDALTGGASQCNVRAERIDDVISNQPITVRILNAIKEAEYVFVVLSFPRENVYYEAGYAEGIGKTPIYVAEEGTPIPFDLKDYPIIFYTNMRELRESIAKKLTAIRTSTRNPGLPGSCS